MKCKYLRPEYSGEDKELLKQLKEDKRLHGISGVALDILFNRGFKTVEDITKHLYSTIDDLYPSYLLKGSDKFCEVVKNSIANNELIINYTDYDTDGILSSATLNRGIKKLGGRIDFYTNNRFIEGYGITPAGVDDLVRKFPDVKLIITTDNGIVGFKGIERAIELGIKVIVTDHHEQGEVLPKGPLAIVNPKRLDDEYPFKGLCGAGVVFKLLLQLYWELDRDLEEVYDLIDLVAIATVGDMVPLVDENRIIVKEGIKRIKNDSKLVFKKLIERLGLSKIDEDTFGFIFAPLLNALGRIKGSPDDAIKLFISEDEAEINELITIVYEVNEYRKSITKTQVDLGVEMVEEIIEKEGKVPNVILLAHETFHEGVVGLVAGRIKEKYHRPTIVLAKHEHTVVNEDSSETIKFSWKGSARSIKGFHIKEVMDSLKEHIKQSGGHAMAGGLAVEDSEIENLRKALNLQAEKLLDENSYTKEVLIDTVIDAKDVTVELVEEFELLKPFGMDFSKPRFGLNNYYVDLAKIKTPYVGKDESTLRLKSTDDLVLIMFNEAVKYRNLGEPDCIKAIGLPALNTFNGITTSQFIVEDNYIFRVKRGA